MPKDKLKFIVHEWALCRVMGESENYYLIEPDSHLVRKSEIITVIPRLLGLEFNATEKKLFDYFRLKLA